jgi:hypothetical protein
MSSETAMTAIGDQVQEMLESSGYPFLGFVLIGQDGVCDYRHHGTTEYFRQVLSTAALEL